MSKPKVALVTSHLNSDLYSSDGGLLDLLSSRGVDPSIQIWDDDSVDWQEYAAVVIRSVNDYAHRRQEFLDWSKSAGRVLNHPDVLEWSSDKHYLLELEKRGLKLIDTTWIESGKEYSKIQVHSRFPALSDFVIKPAVSSELQDIKRYSSSSIIDRQNAITQTMQLLGENRDVMLQRYLETIDELGEISFIFFNGLLSHSVKKTAFLKNNSLRENEKDANSIVAYEPTIEQVYWAETLRKAVHGYIKDRLGHDLQLLYLRADMVTDPNGNFLVMQLSLVDANLYLDTVPEALGNFADAICVRVFA